MNRNPETPRPSGYRTRRPILGGRPRRDASSINRCADCGEHEIGRAHV